MKLRSCAPYLQDTFLSSLLSDFCRSLFDLCRTQTTQKNLRFLYLAKEKYSITDSLFNRQSPHTTYPSTQALTVYFDGQLLGGVVWCSHIVGVGHTAVGPLRVPSCSGDSHDKTLGSLLDFHGIVAPRSLPNWMPFLHVLVKGGKERKTIIKVEISGVIQK